MIFLLLVLNGIVNKPTSLHDCLMHSVRDTLLQLATIALVTVTYRLSRFHPLSSFPGPILCKCTSFKLAHITYTGKRHEIIASLHAKHGKVVRTGTTCSPHSSIDYSHSRCLGPNTLSINSHAAVAPIYSGALAMDKSTAYDIPGLAGRSIFFMQTKEEHGPRRRIWTPAFSSDS